MEHQRAVKGIDFVQCLEPDMSVYIMSFLDDPSDLVRACAVSSFWREFIITKGLAKQLCVKTYTQFANIVNIVDISKPNKNSVGTQTEWEILKRDHEIYASLHWAVLKANGLLRDCLQSAVSASSSDLMTGSVDSTVRRKGTGLAAGYWSSTGQSDPMVPETLIYEIRSGIWVITEIDIKPSVINCYFQSENPVYSAKSVRFRLGHLRPVSEIGGELGDLPLDGAAVSDKFHWTYTSPEFPMLQENRKQRFMLPEPVLWVEGYLQVELLGRVQRHEKDGLFYLSVGHVQALGRILDPQFHMTVREPYGFKDLELEYVPEDVANLLKSSTNLDFPYWRHRIAIQTADWLKRKNEMKGRS